MSHLEEARKYAEWQSIGNVDNNEMAEAIEDHCYALKIPIKRNDLSDGSVEFLTIYKYKELMERAIRDFSTGCFIPTEIDYSKSFHGQAVPHVDHIEYHQKMVGTRLMNIQTRTNDRRPQRRKMNFDLMFISLSFFFAAFAFYLFVQKFMR